MGSAARKRSFYGGAVASFLRRGWKPTAAELGLGNPPSQSDSWETTPHTFMAKPWEREGDLGYDGDPESCALCHFTEGNPIHGTCVDGQTHEVVDPPKRVRHG